MAPKSPQQNAYGYPAPSTPVGAGGSQPATIVAKRNPTTSDVGYPLGQIWDNKITNQPWILSSVAGGLANWVLMGAGSGSLNTINNVAAVASNINLTSTGATVTITPGVGTVNLEVAAGAGVSSIAGTANQIAASSPTGAVTLSLIGPYTPATYTAFGVLYGNGTSSIGATAVGTAGQVLTSNGAGLAPTFQAAASSGVTSITGTANQIAASSPTGAVTLSLVGPYTPATYTSHGVLLGEGTSSIVATSPGTAGQVLTSNGAGADPTFQAPSAGSISITPNTGTNVTNTNYSLLGTSVAAAGIPLRSNGTAANSIQLEVQRTSAQGASSAANAGIASFTNGQFSADANGFVALAGPYTPATYTAHGVLLGEGTGSIVATAAMTNGQLLIGSTGADPVPASLTSTGGTIAVTGGAGTLNIDVAGTSSGTVTTVGAVTGNVLTFALGGSIAVSSYDVLIVGNDTTSTLGVGYSLFGTVRTNGTTATVVGTPDVIANEDAGNTGATVTIIASANNAIVQVTGVAAKTINWKAIARAVTV